MPGAMTSAIALWIFSSLHKQSWQNIQVIRVRHCDHWFQELKIDTWPSERPWDLLPSLEASSCLCLYCHSWIKFSELDQYDWLALILRVSCTSHSLSLSPALGPNWLSLKVGTNWYPACASGFGVWERPLFPLGHHLVKKWVKVCTGPSFIRWWVKVCTGSLLH